MSLFFYFFHIILFWVNAVVVITMIFGAHFISVCQSGFLIVCIGTMHFSLNVGSKAEAMSSSSRVSVYLCVAVFLSDIVDYLIFITSVRSLSSYTAKIELLKRCRVGVTKGTLTYFFPESASVNSTRGLSVLSMASSTSVFCHEGVKCLAFQSVHRTCAVAFCCSSTLAIGTCQSSPSSWTNYFPAVIAPFFLFQVPLFPPTVGIATDQLLAEPHFMICLLTIWLCFPT